jgi:hypothetical protein
VSKVTRVVSVRLEYDLSYDKIFVQVSQCCELSAFEKLQPQVLKLSKIGYHIFHAQISHACALSQQARLCTLSISWQVQP